uniref:Uncharacterized protein n=1 Tax=Rhizophora mucronata TaxID=61149 RepID=A0A2P2PWC5_RHIMU
MNWVIDKLENWGAYALLFIKFAAFHF